MISVAQKAADDPYFSENMATTDISKTETGDKDEVKERNEMVSAPTRFRSLLPHEPTPDDDDSGYIHIQGALLPKVLTDESSIGGTSQATDKVSATDGEDDHHVFDVKEHLWQALRRGYYTHEGDNQKWPHTIVSVHVDPTCSTKARLVYESPRAARDMVHLLRHCKISPADLMRKKDDTEQQQYPTITWSTRPLQATQLTTAPLPSMELGWPRSNPPKFRRLLPTPEGDDAFDLEEQRKKTRFVFITGLAEPNNDEEDASISKTLSNPHSAVLDAIRTIMTTFDSTGTGIEIFLPSTKKMAPGTNLPRYCYVGMRSNDDAQRLIVALQGQQVDWNLGPDDNSDSDISIRSGKLFLDYADVTQRSYKHHSGNTTTVNGIAPERGEPSKPECTSATDHVIVPGLLLIQDFVSPAEEEVAMAVLTGPTAPWAPQQTTPSSGHIRRRVQHYGYVFDYETANVLRDRTSSPSAACPPVPSLPILETNHNIETYISKTVEELRGWETLAGLIERTRRTHFSSIASTPSESREESPSDAKSTGHTSQNDVLESNDIGIESRGDSKASSIESSLVFPMINQMTVNEYMPGQGIGSHTDTHSAFGDGLISISLNGGVVMEFRHAASGVRKLVYLPPRSLLLLSGPARYEWEHMIVSRRTDTVNGTVLPRKLRVSLTLRTAISDEEHPKPLDRIETCHFPPRWNTLNSNNSICALDGEHGEHSESKGDTLISELVTPDTEKLNVHAVYDAIATQWHHTRGKRGVLWPGATQFLQNLPPASIVADVGCGDGKYFPAIWEAGSYVIGTDISRPLLETSVGSCGIKDSSTASAVPDNRQIDPIKAGWNDRPAVAVADCMNVPLRTGSCDAAICIAVMHHLSTVARRVRCLSELARIVRVGGTINVQAWALEQEDGSRRKFAGTDVFVPFNAQPRYLDKVAASLSKKKKHNSVDPPRVPSNDDTQSVEAHGKHDGKGVAEMYSDAYEGAEFDERKGLVVFKRYCHLYREGEMSTLVSQVKNLELVESGYETGNHFVILKVVAPACDE